jgi:hypothetical protein
VFANYGIIFFEQKIYIRNSDSPFASYVMTHEVNRVNFGADYPLPFAFFSDTFREFVPEETRRSHEEAEIMGRTALDARLLRDLPEDSRVLDIEITAEEMGDALVITALVAVIEPIGESRTIEGRGLGSPPLITDEDTDEDTDENTDNTTD